MRLGKRKPKKTPRQKVQKGLDVFKDWLKTQKPKDLVDAALNISLAYASYQHFTTEDEEGRIHHNPLNALFGPISLKLAMTDGIVSQGAGVAGLLALGVSMGGTEWIDLPDMTSWDAFVEKERERAKKSKYAWRI